MLLILGLTRGASCHSLSNTTQPHPAIRGLFPQDSAVVGVVFRRFSDFGLTRIVAFVASALVGIATLVAMINL